MEHYDHLMPGTTEVTEKESSWSATTSMQAASSNDASTTMLIDLVANATYASWLDRKPEPHTVWLAGLVAVTLISMWSLLGGALKPVVNKLWARTLLLFLMGASVGIQAGTCVYFLIPSAIEYDISSMPHRLKFVFTISLMLAMAMLLLNLELIFKFLSDSFTEDDDSNRPLSAGSFVLQQFQTEANTNNAVVRSNKEINARHAAHHNRRDRTCCIRAPPLVWIIFVGDLVHNFLDGMSIGVTMQGSISEGIAIGIAILAEALPHKVGNLAVTINAGLSVGRAVAFSLVSSLSIYAGLSFGILAGQLNGHAATWIYGLTAGLFTYIAFTDILPEVAQQVLGNQAGGHGHSHLSALPTDNQNPRRDRWLRLIIADAGLLLGIGISMVTCIFANA